MKARAAFGIARPGQDGHGLGRHEGVLGRDELDVEAGQLLLEGHVGGHREARRELALGDHGGHVTAARGEVAGIGGEPREPLPALLLAEEREHHLVGRVGRRGARGRALGDLALELGVEQIVPFLRLGRAQPLDALGVVHEPVRLERGADPEPVLVLEGNGLGLADRGGDGIPRGLRDLDLLEQLLLGQLLEERRLAAPEDVHLRLALPLDDAPVGDGRAGGNRAHLDRDVPLLLGVVGEGLERGVVDELGHGGDQVELALDGRRALGQRRRPQAPLEPAAPPSSPEPR